MSCNKIRTNVSVSFYGATFIKVKEWSEDKRFVRRSNLKKLEEYKCRMMNAGCVIATMCQTFYCHFLYHVIRHIEMI